MKENLFEGYELFNQIEEEEIRCYNRGVVMANIFEDHPYREGGVSAAGLAKLIGYFKNIEDVERVLVLECFKAVLNDRGLTAPAMPTTVH